MKIFFNIIGGGYAPNFEGKKDKVQKQPSTHVTSPLKAVPLAVLLAMSPVTEIGARDIMNQEQKDNFEIVLPDNAVPNSYTDKIVKAYAGMLVRSATEGKGKIILCQRDNISRNCGVYFIAADENGDESDAESCFIAKAGVQFYPNDHISNYLTMANIHEIEVIRYYCSEEVGESYKKYIGKPFFYISGDAVNYKSVKMTKSGKIVDKETEGFRYYPKCRIRISEDLYKDLKELYKPFIDAGEIKHKISKTNFDDSEDFEDFFDYDLNRVKITGEAVKY